MLELVIPPRENIIETPEGDVFFGEETQGATLFLEHSLISVSKWESKYKKAFLNNSIPKTKEESIYYVKCMSLNKNIPDNVYNNLTDLEIDKINKYIDDPMTATWFSEDKQKNRRRSRDIITSELIYYWMVALNIPTEYEKWHLNRLMTLIRICEIKQQDPKKMKKSDIYERNRRLNASRRKATGSRG